MSYKVHISLNTIDEKIDYFIMQYDGEPYENGPTALRELYEFIIDGVANKRFDDSSVICEHVKRRLQEYWEAE